MKSVPRALVPLGLVVFGNLVWCSDADAQLLRRRARAPWPAARVVQPAAPRTGTYTAPTPRPYYPSPAADHAIRSQVMRQEMHQHQQSLRQMTDPHNPSSPMYRGPSSSFSPMNQYNPSSPMYRGPSSSLSPLRSPMDRYNPSSPSYRAPSFSTPSYRPSTPSYRPSTPSYRPSPSISRPF
jgi:DNA-directed RNA polymerase II subunit RPB1